VLAADMLREGLSTRVNRGVMHASRSRVDANDMSDSHILGAR